MKSLCALLLLMSTSVVAQQQSIPPYNSSPTTPPSTFPQDQRPGERMPPDTRAPAPSQPTDAEVQEQINQKLATEPLLEHLGLKATANSHTIVLSGSVDNEQQHKLALRIAQSYAGERKIVDKITIRD
jgi:BON domain